MDNDNKKIRLVDGASSPNRPRRSLWNRKISLLRLLPSSLTLLAMYFGFTCLYFSTTGQYPFVVGLIFAAAFLDMMDGRVARYVNQESKLGEQLDSLADFLNFGVAPAFAMWFWGLNEFSKLGWVMAFFFVACVGLRLARFNASIGDENLYDKRFFVGVPAPAGGLLVFLPMVLSFLGLQNQFVLDVLMVVCTLGTGVLMASTIPTYSIKNIRLRLPRANFIPALLLVVLSSVIIFNYPFPALLLLGIVYMISIPIACFVQWRSTPPAP